MAGLVKVVGLACWVLASAWLVGCWRVGEVRHGIAWLTSAVAVREKVRAEARQKAGQGATRGQQGANSL